MGPAAALLLLWTAATAGQGAEAPNDAAGMEHTFDLGVVVTGGVGASHVWVTPLLSPPAPGLGIRARYKLRFAEQWRIHFAGSAAFGGSQDGTPIGLFGGYRATVGLGHRWFDLGWIEMWSEVHKGINSLALVPIPVVGTGHELSVYPLGWLDLDWVDWDVSLGLDADLYVIAPSLIGTAKTGLMFRLWRIELGLEARVSGQVLVAVAANAANASASLRVLSGFRL